MPVCRSSILVTATISPGPASSTGSVSSACTSNSWPSLTPLRDAARPARSSSFFSVPEKTRMKLSFCTKGSMRVLKTWATSGPAGIGLDLDRLRRRRSSAVRCDGVGRQGAEGQGVEQLRQAHARLARARRRSGSARPGPRPGRSAAASSSSRRLRALEVALHHRPRRPR